MLILFFLRFIMCCFKTESLSFSKAQKSKLGIPVILVVLFIFFSLSATGHGMVADGLVGSVSSDIGFPIA